MSHSSFGTMMARRRLLNTAVGGVPFLGDSVAMSWIRWIGLAICLWGAPAMAADGLITVRSNYGPAETIEPTGGCR